MNSLTKNALVPGNSSQSCPKIFEKNVSKCEPQKLPSGSPQSFPTAALALFILPDRPNKNRLNHQPVFICRERTSPFLDYIWGVYSSITTEV